VVNTTPRKTSVLKLKRAILGHFERKTGLTLPHLGSAILEMS
jgi:hypothetical protein